MRLVSRQWTTQLRITSAIVVLLWTSPLLSQSIGGLKADITSVKFSADRRAEVTFAVSDARGKSLELSDLDANSVKFTIAAIKAEPTGATNYHNYILSKIDGKVFVHKSEIKQPALAETFQPSFDQGGTLKQVRSGVFTYSFKTALPANYDRNATHVVCSAITLKNAKQVANPVMVSTTRRITRLDYHFGSASS